jgi:hypothetical protein
VWGGSDVEWEESGEESSRENPRACLIESCYSATAAARRTLFFFVVVQHGGPVCFLSFVIFSKKNLICERRSGFILLMYCGISLFLYKE